MQMLEASATPPPPNGFPAIQNISPSVWGRPAWKFLHAIALSYPDSPSAEHRQAAQALYHSLSLLLPCDQCNLNLAKELRDDPPDVSSRQALNAWTLSLHNSVSRRLRKPQMAPSDVVQLVFGDFKPVRTQVGGPSAASAASAASVAGPSPSLPLLLVAVAVTAVALSAGLIVSMTRRKRARMY